LSDNRTKSSRGGRVAASNGYGDIHAYCYGDGEPDTDGYANCYRDINADRYANRHSYRYSNGDTEAYAYAEGNANTAAASNAAAQTIACITTKLLPRNSRLDLDLPACGWTERQAPNVWLLASRSSCFREVNSGAFSDEIECFLRAGFKRSTR
jgi:hypothetical protein